MKKDPTAESRKRDHIDLAFQSQITGNVLDSRFYYEPIVSGHPTSPDLSTDILGTTLKVPIWVSSMTGGTEKAKTININLAKACEEFGMGMGLGSCRAILESDDRLSDFDIKKYMPSQPLYANLGIAQIEELIDGHKLGLIDELMSKLDADGLIIHVNPMQEWLQPEGDLIKYPPIDTIKKVIAQFPKLRIIVKEVGQGMGPKSLLELYKLPIQAVDFGAAGGTNFAKLELLRASENVNDSHGQLAYMGHTAYEMVKMVNDIFSNHSNQIRCRETIVSGGVKDYLDGYYLINRLKSNAIYGQASGFLKHSMGDYEKLRKHVNSQLEGLAFASSFLQIRK